MYCEYVLKSVSKAQLTNSFWVRLVLLLLLFVLTSYVNHCKTTQYKPPLHMGSAGKNHTGKNKPWGLTWQYAKTMGM